jgi:hypothetical protein
MAIGWADCIVTFIDLVDTKKGAETGAASALMQQLHHLVPKAVARRSLPSVRHVYTWNDSVLVVSNVDRTAASFSRALIDLQTLKTDINGLCRNYAIAIKGRAFPPFQTSVTKRVTVLEASSWAMANCFAVEKALKSRQATWYIDSWILRKVETLRSPAGQAKVLMLPRRRARIVHFFKHDDLFGDV